MKFLPRLVVAASLSGAITLNAQARIERTIEKSFTVQPGGTLHVETLGGEIRVSASNDPVVKVTAREKIRADSDAEADEVLKKLTLTMEQNGDDVTAIAKYESMMPGFHWGSWPPVNVDFIVTVPAKYAADLHTSGGGITVGDLNGKVLARTSGGSVKLGKIGADVDARTSGGNVTLDEAAGSVQLHSSGGNIAVGRASGPAELSTSGGGIKIDSVANAIHASTSGGSVRATIAGPLKDDCVLSTSGGSVKVTVDKSAAFRLDASTSGGNVDAAGLTIMIENGSPGRSRLAGAVNGGGPLLKLRSSGGGIVVKSL